MQGKVLNNTQKSVENSKRKNRKQAKNNKNKVLNAKRKTEKRKEERFNYLGNDQLIKFHFD